MRLMILLALATLLAVTCFGSGPAAAAGPLPASLTLTLDPSTASTLRPGGESIVIEGTVEYRQQVWEPSPFGVEVKLDIMQQPAWATIVLEPATIVLTSPMPGPTPATRGAFRALVTAAEFAPAYRVEFLQIQATVAATPVHAEAVTDMATALVASYVGRLEARAPTAQLRLEPGSAAHVVVEVRNLGNGMTRVVFSAPSNPGGLMVGFPQAPTLGAAAAGESGTEARVVVTIAAPAAWTERASVVLLLEPVYALDANLRGEPVELRFDVHPVGPSEHVVKSQAGLGNAVPSHSLLGAMAALAAASIVAARRR